MSVGNQAQRLRPVAFAHQWFLDAFSLLVYTGEQTVRGFSSMEGALR